MVSQTGIRIELALQTYWTFYIQSQMRKTMETEDERILLDSGCASYEQLQYAIQAAQKAGLEVVSFTNGMSWQNSVTINTSPQRTLSMCWRDGDYWVTSSEGLLWPKDGSYGFQHEKPFRQALHAFLTDESTDGPS